MFGYLKHRGGNERHMVKEMALNGPDVLLVVYKIYPRSLHQLESGFCLAFHSYVPPCHLFI